MTARQPDGVQNSAPDRQTGGRQESRTQAIRQTDGKAGSRSPDMQGAAISLWLEGRIRHGTQRS